MSWRSLLPLALVVSVVVTATGESVEGILPPFYSGKEIRAMVVDAETGQALEGAVIVAVWALETLSGKEPIQVSEVLSDAKGELVTPGWGPKPRPTLSHAASASPFLLIFKSRYVPVRLPNASKRDFARLRAMTNLTADQIAYRIPSYDGNPYDTMQESLWDGMVIRIDRFRGTPEEWFRKLENIAIYAGWDHVKYMRRLYESLLAEHEYFKTYPPDSKRVDKRTVESFFVNIDNQLKRAGSQ